MIAAPAAAQVEQEGEQEGESGEVDQSFEVSGGGSNGNQCVGISGVGQSGNAQNQSSIVHYGSRVDDIEFEDSGSTITTSPEGSTECVQEVNQAASAAGEAAPAPKAAPAPAPKAVPAPAPKATPAPAPKAEAAKAEEKKAEAKQAEQKKGVLPATGGTQMLPLILGGLAVAGAGMLLWMRRS